MNTSHLLPPEIMHMATLSSDWANPQEAQTPQPTCALGAYLPVSSPHNGFGALCPLYETISQFSPQFSSNYQRHLCLDLSVPELPHIPLSCTTNDSLATVEPFSSVSELSLSSYVPDLNALGSSPALKFSEGCEKHISLTDSNFQWINSSNETIHSPKPIFAYKTLQFDLDRTQSPQIDVYYTSFEADVAHSRKRRRDEDFHEDTAYLKRRRMSLDLPDNLPLTPEPTVWVQHSFVRETCTTEPLPVMDIVSDSIYDWNDTWPEFVLPQLN